MNRQEVSAALMAAGIENAAWEATLLTEAFSGEALATATKKRCQHYPLQYLLGEWCFYRETYEVSEHCLIPRSDTEILVEEAIKQLPPKASFLDLCTGSGCVAISTLANRPDTCATAIDLFEQTLDIAARNAARNGVEDRLSLCRATVLQAPPEVLPRGGFDALLSNPPYIQNSVVPTLQREVAFEPAAALCGGEDGLDFYRAILEKWTCLLKPNAPLFFEIGYDQAAAIGALAESHGYSCTVKKDFSKNDRVAILKRK